jgi:hypothetical protein
MQPKTKLSFQFAAPPHRPAIVAAALCSLSSAGPARTQGAPVAWGFLTVFPQAAGAAR